MTSRLKVEQAPEEEKVFDIFQMGKKYEREDPKILRC